MWYLQWLTFPWLFCVTLCYDLSRECLIQDHWLNLKSLAAGCGDLGWWGLSGGSWCLASEGNTRSSNCILLSPSKLRWLVLHHFFTCAVLLSKCIGQNLYGPIPLKSGAKINASSLEVVLLRIWLQVSKVTNILQLYHFYGAGFICEDPNFYAS